MMATHALYDPNAGLRPAAPIMILSPNKKILYSRGVNHTIADYMALANSSTIVFEQTSSDKQTVSSSLAVSS